MGVSNVVADEGEFAESDVSDLPYDDGRFNLVVAINSHYFWSDLAEDLREIMRVLQPSGTVALAGGEYFGGKHDTRNRRLAANGRMNCQTLPELRDTLCEAGYSNTEIHEEWNKGWFCVVGRKPVVDTEGGVVEWGRVERLSKGPIYEWGLCRVVRLSREPVG